MYIKKYYNKNEKKITNLISPFTKDTNFDILGVAIGFFIAIVNFVIEPPNNTLQWILKIVEIVGVISAAYAIGLIINMFIRDKRVEIEKLRLEQIAKRENKSINEFICEQITDISKIVEKWARLHKVKCRILNYSTHKQTIDFKDFIIDFIEIQVVDYQLLFTVRINEVDIVKSLLSYVLHSEIKMNLIMNEHYLGPEAKIRIDTDSLYKIKSALINSILNPIHTKLYL